MKKNDVTTIVAMAIGSAIMFVLFKFVNIPTPIPNTSLQVAYGFLALFATVFGPLPAAFTGFVAHWLNDALTYGSVWYSWVIVTAFVGFGLGVVMRGNKVEQGIFDKKDQIRFIVGQAVVNLIGWMGLAPLLDVLIYAEPAEKVFTQGVVAGITNAIVTGVVGYLLITAYAKTRTKSGSLSAK